MPCSLALLAALVAAAPAQAYKLGGKKWPVRTITYHVGIPQYAEAIAAATRAWNTSGADVRLKEVAQPRRARLRIVDGGEGGPRARPRSATSGGGTCSP